MQIRLDLIEDEPFVWDETESIGVETVERSDLLALTDIDWSGSIAKAHPGYRFQAATHYGQTMACGRCLTPCEETVDSKIDLIAVIGAPEPPGGLTGGPVGGEVQLDASDLGVLNVEGNTLETTPILMEHIELNLPMNVLCTPDCAGLCPSCGANRNEDPACCEGPAIDPRWQGLKDLKLS